MTLFSVKCSSELGQHHSSYILYDVEQRINLAYFLFCNSDKTEYRYINVWANNGSQNLRFWVFNPYIHCVTKIFLIFAFIFL